LAARDGSDTADKRAWLRSLGVGAAFLAAALIVARATSSWIGTEFPDRPLPPDLLFDTLPYVAKAGYLADIALVAALVLLGVYALRGNAREIPVMMTLFGIMEIARALINVLTPLASPLNRGPYYGLSVPLEHAFTRLFAPLVGTLQTGTYYGMSISEGLVHLPQNGEFPSGHMASVFLCMLFVDRAKSPRIWIAMVVLVVVEAVSLLMSHQHYSIDVVGGLLLSYFIYHEYAEGKLFNWLKPFITV